MQENNTKTIHRLQEYAPKTGVSLNSIATKLGISNSYFSKMVRNSGSIGSDIIERIVRIYPNLSIEWLITGNGEMLKNVPSDMKHEEKTGCPPILSPTCPLDEKGIISNVNELNRKELNNKHLNCKREYPLLFSDEEFALFQQEMRVFEYLTKANKVKRLYDNIIDFIGNIDMSLKYCHHYYYGDLFEYIDAYINKQIDKKQLLESFKNNLDVVKELESIIKPYLPIMEKLYYDLEDFNQKRDRLYDIGDIESNK